MAFEVEPDDRGVYGLCIFGAEELSKEKVEEEFGKFGKILSENRHTNKVFIRFATKEEATSCLTAYKNHSTYRVKPAMKKTPSENQRNGDDFSRRNGSTNQRPQQRGFVTRNDTNAADNSESQRRDVQPIKPKPGLVPVYVPSEEEKNKPPPEELVGLIVANLHPDMKQQDVFQLCQRAKSPAVHVVMRNFQRGFYRRMYYALVYMENDKDVDNIVKGLHGLVVNGYELTVKSLETYDNEAKEELSEKK